MRFQNLVADIAHLFQLAEWNAGQSFQRLLSARNWLIGAYIVVFEQSGEDRAAYGARLLEQLAEALGEARCHGLSRRNLYNFRRVALTYPDLDPGRLFPVREDVSKVLDLRYLKTSKTSATSPPEGQILQTSAESQSENRHPLPWRDQAWLQRLFSELSIETKMLTTESHGQSWLFAESASPLSSG